MNYTTLLVELAAKYFIIIPVALAAYYYFRNPNERKRMLGVGIITFIVAGIFLILAGEVYYNPRPFVENNTIPLIPHSPDNGFPSNHALLAATISAILFLFSKKLSVYGWILTVLIGGARVYAQVHHTVDILGSVFIAILATIIAFFTYRWFESRQ